MLEAKRGNPRIGADQTVRDVLIHYPATGPIFLQHGPMFTVKPGELYLKYEELTLERYAALNRIALDPLLKLLNAAAANEEPRLVTRENPYRRAPASGDLGYTGGRREGGPDLELAPVVEVQTARGPV
jgi:hypothetical protein